MDNVTKLNNVLKGYSIKAECKKFCSYDNFDIFYIELLNSKISSLENISRELQLHLRLEGQPLFIPDNNSGLLQMVSSKKNKEKLFLKDIIKQKATIRNSFCQIGSDMLGNVVDLDLTKAPHMLVVGTTGSGKSVFLNVLIANIFNMGWGAKLYLIDPKLVEFSRYANLPLSNVETVTHCYYNSLFILDRLEGIMNDRYKWLSQNKFTSVKEAAKVGYFFENYFLIIDEFADLISYDKNGSFTQRLCNLAAKSRAAGIHLIIATQRASASIIDGKIKANFPTRIMFKVASSIESRIVIDVNGGENLSLCGDGLLFGYNGDSLKRFKSAYVEYDEVISYTSAIKKHIKKYGEVFLNAA